jgi:hypothetical protein
MIFEFSTISGGDDDGERRNACCDLNFGVNSLLSFFFDPSRRGWVPIPPITELSYSKRAQASDGAEHSRTMLPLRLSWAWTIWKAQGQTIKGKLVVSLGPKEKEHGLTYVAFSRATKFSNIGIIRGIADRRDTFDHPNLKFSKNEKEIG